MPTRAFLALFLLICLLVAAVPSAAATHRILYVDSYHPEYIWSQDCLNGAKGVLAGRKDVELKVFYLDTKRSNKTEEGRLRIAQKAKRLIEEYKPTVVIVADDNAADYLAARLFASSSLPFVFSGLNWDASVYGFPNEHVTGMIEVCLVRDLLDTLSSFAKGKKIGYLASDTESERKELINIKKRFGLKFEERLVKTLSELKAAFVELQRSNDMVIIQECRSVDGFDHAKMVEFVRKNTTKPTGAMQKYLIHYALITYAKVGEEQGEWAARTALAIIDGKKPSDFPVAENRKARIILNMDIANVLSIRFPRRLLEQAAFASEVDAE